MTTNVAPLLAADIAESAGDSLAAVLTAWRADIDSTPISWSATDLMSLLITR